MRSVPLTAALAASAFSILASGQFIVTRTGDDISYAFGWPDSTVSIGLAIAAGLAVQLLHVMTMLAARRVAPSPTVRDGRWLAPLIALPVVAIGLAPAVFGARSAPLAYLFFDMRWWWAIACVAIALVRLDGLMGDPIRTMVQNAARRRSRARLWLTDLSLALVVVIWAVATTPNIRFVGGVHGDEPRYLRYAELWYQGGGIDISDVKPLAALSLGEPPKLGRVARHFFGAVGQEARTLAADLRSFARHPRTFRWNRAHGEGGSFVTGKRGGIHQLHMPGLAVLLFPGYAIDRWSFDGPLEDGDQERPSSLVMTNAMMLGLYAVAAVALFRFLRRALESNRLAFVWSLVAMLSLPMTAFPFQLYPELPALTLVVSSLNYALFHNRRDDVRIACVAGLASAGLAWLHPRFLIVAAGIALTVFLRTRGAPRRAYVTAFVAVILSVMAFQYRITGSWSPVASYAAARADDAFRPEAVVPNLIGYALDRRYGILPHTPILFLAVPGLMLLFKRAPGQALAVAGIGLALCVTAAGHSLTAAAGTPGRMILAIVPLFIWPAAIAVRACWSSPFMRALALALMTVSIETGRAYNWTHVKERGPMAGLTSAGWRPNLAFPLIRGEAWETSWDNFTLLLVFVALVVSSAIVGWILMSRRSRREPAANRRPVLAAASAIVLLASFLVYATSLNNDWFSDEYLIVDISDR